MTDLSRRTPIPEVAPDAWGWGRTDPSGLAFAERSGLLERAAHLRADPERVATLRRRKDTHVLALWRGRPLFEGGALHLLPHDHPLLDEAEGLELFLGCAQGRPVFARDVSALEPDGDRPSGAAFFDPSEQHHPGLPHGVVFAELRGRLAVLTPLEAEIAATARAMLEWHRTHGFCAACGVKSDPEEAGGSGVARPANGAISRVPIRS